MTLGLCQLLADLKACGRYCYRIASIASSPQGLQFTCSAVGRLLTTNPTGDLNAPRVGKLSVWDLRTMKAEVCRLLNTLIHLL